MVTLGVVGAIAAAWVVSCNESDPKYEAVCTDTTTMIRLEDHECPQDGSEHNGHSFVYYPIGRYSHPPVGSRVADGYSVSKPSGGYRVGGVPVRGGFGARTGGFTGG